MSFLQAICKKSNYYGNDKRHDEPGFNNGGHGTRQEHNLVTIRDSCDKEAHIQYAESEIRATQEYQDIVLYFPSSQNCLPLF